MSRINRIQRLGRLWWNSIEFSHLKPVFSIISISDETAVSSQLRESHYLANSTMQGLDTN